MQLQIKFPLFSQSTAENINKSYKEDQITKLNKELQKYKNIIRTYKGHTTKRKTKNN
jgi:hypothetical protein